MWWRPRWSFQFLPVLLDSFMQHSNIFILSLIFINQFWGRVELLQLMLQSKMLNICCRKSKEVYGLQRTWKKKPSIYSCQRFTFLDTSGTLGLSRELRNFYSCIIESILVENILTCAWQAVGGVLLSFLTCTQSAPSSAGPNQEDS